ncbi:kynurenine--oxoglutarate transaminase 3-like isoform X2 [Tubulanus polymorphus]
MSKKVVPADRTRGVDKNVWVEFGKLSTDYKALNLGQGFPDFAPPQFVIDALSAATRSDNALMNQYTRSTGHPRLVNALANTFSPIMKREIDPMNEIIITVGAFGSLYYTIQGLVNPGDEVIIIEPFFDCYEPMVRVAGGTPVFIPLRPKAPPAGKMMSSGDWHLDPEELAGKFTEKTKLIIVNTPHNPTGKIFTADELELIRSLCIKHDVVCVADEVYEWLVYKGHQHIKIATLPGMWERTLTIGSAGKTFSATGWKVGWTIGPQYLIKALQIIHQNSLYTTATPIQEALAVGFECESQKIGTSDCYFHQLPAELQPKRDRLAKMLLDIGAVPMIPEGGYFMMADVSNIKFETDGTDDPKDFQFVRWMTKQKRLSAIPPSAFYSSKHKHLAENLVRFTFIKKDESLDAAEKIFQQWKKDL